jgi:AraC-like DNA-binding protein
MTDELYLDNVILSFVQGFPALYSGYQLPQAHAKYASGPWGTICIQELRSEDFLLRHFFFMIRRSLKIVCKEKGEGLQSLISLKGEMDYSADGLPRLLIPEHHFLLLNVHELHASLFIRENRTCSLLNVFYKQPLYERLLSYFPNFKKQLSRAEKKPVVFNILSRRSRYTIHDAIQDIWLDRYLPVLQEKYIALRLEASLFTQLADSYSLPVQDRASAIERAKADAARDLMLANIRKHFTADEIALHVNCSTSWLKKAFSKAYGMGPYHFLREHRMYKAKEMLLRGESLKAVAIEVGMKPRNFPKEFKSFFGYTVTELKKGMYR